MNSLKIFSKAKQFPSYLKSRIMNVYVPKKEQFNDPTIRKKFVLPNGDTLYLTSLTNGDYKAELAPKEGGIKETIITSETYILVLITVGIPKSGYEIVDSTDTSIYKPYFYLMSPSGSGFSLSKVELDSSFITPGNKGMNLTVQSDGENIRHNLADSYTPYEEEIGAVDIRRSALGLPDINLRWGQEIIDTDYNILIEGSDYAQYGPETELYKTAEARHQYELDSDGNVIRRWFFFSRVPTMPMPFDTNGYITWNFSGRLEVINLLRQGPFEYQIGCYAVDANGNDGEVLLDPVKYTDYHDDGVNWAYHVPIAALSQDTALMRKVVSTGDYSTFPCGEQSQEEKLLVGDIELDSGIYDVEVSYSVGTMTATKTRMNTTDVVSISLEGVDCPIDKIGWTMELYPAGAPGWRLNRYGDYAILESSGVAGCSEARVTADCGGCGTTSMTFVINGGWMDMGDPDVYTPGDGDCILAPGLTCYVFMSGGDLGYGCYYYLYWDAGCPTTWSAGPCPASSDGLTRTDAPYTPCGSGQGLGVMGRYRWGCYS